MIKRVLAVASLSVAVFIGASAVRAQSAPDGEGRLVLPTAGVFQFEAVPGTETGPVETQAKETCFVRVDTDPVQVLGCAPAVPGQLVKLEATVPVTSGHDAVVRAVSKDATGNVSQYSTRYNVLDFTAPPPPDLH